MSFEQMMAELRAEYLASMPEKIKQIENHWTEKDLNLLQDDFHKLKGSGKTYGIPEISELGEAFEKLCKNSANTNADVFSKYLGTALRLLSEILHKRLSGQAHAVNLDAEFQKIAELVSNDIVGS